MYNSGARGEVHIQKYFVRNVSYALEKIFLNIVHGQRFQETIRFFGKPYAPSRRVESITT